MNVSSVREYTIFAHAQLLRNSRVQRPRNKGIPDCPHKDSLLHGGGPASDFIPIQQHVTVLDCFLNVGLHSVRLTQFGLIE
jgi:hypothetical protein